ncbi:nitrilase-related carbon-nitrogen hydrolase, partial [Anaerolineales bacterium HSG6]|nr:nitrilase-related carbon-nitrogen hydrolase [Anaerolineales bacterium HSG6]
ELVESRPPHIPPQGGEASSPSQREGVRGRADFPSNAQFRDTATIHNPQGDMVGYTRKVHIPSGEGYHETHFFQGEADYPVHELDSVKVAVPTCYDQWFPEMSRICALNGAEFIFYPTAIGSEPTAPEVDSQEAWQTVMRGQAIANGVYIAAANRTGVENGVTFYGSSFICDPAGQILAQASRDQTELVIADLDPVRLHQWRSLFPLLHQRRPETYQPILNTMPDPPPERWQRELS